MVSERKIKTDGKIIGTIVKKYCNEENAQFAFLANKAGNNFFTYSGDIKLLIDGVALLLGSIAASSENITNDVFNYVATTAKRVCRMAKGLPEEENENVETVEGKDTAQSKGSTKARNSQPAKPRPKRSKSGEQADGQSGKRD